MQTQLINFTISKITLSQVDKLAKVQAQSRAELLREAVRIYLAGEEARKRSFDLIQSAAMRNTLAEKTALNLVDKIRDSLPMNQ